MQHINQHREFSLHHGSELLLQGGHYILGKKKKNVIRNYVRPRKLKEHCCGVEQYCAMGYWTHFCQPAARAQVTVKQPHVFLHATPQGAGGGKVPITICLAVLSQISPLQ